MSSHVQMKQLFIAPRIKVGFNERRDTYTGRLAYVVYYDLKGNLRKEKSWEAWRDKRIPAVEHENTPADGFVLNKGVGGARGSYGWNARNEYIRVHDPRGFEFEISVANLLFILRETGCSPGKGLEGQFVYAWDGPELVLLPTCAQDYKNSTEYTALQNKSVKIRDLIPGATYVTKKQQPLVYLGRFNQYDQTGKWRARDLNEPFPCRKLVFWDPSSVNGAHPAADTYVFMDGPKQIGSCQDETCVPNYAALVDGYNKSVWGSPVQSLYVKKVRRTRQTCGADNWAVEETTRDGVKTGSFLLCDTNYDWPGKTVVESITVLSKASAKEGRLVFSGDMKIADAPFANTKTNHRNYCYGLKRTDWIEPTRLRLFARLESGAEFQVSSGCLVTPQQLKTEEEKDDGQED